MPDGDPRRSLQSQGAPTRLCPPWLCVSLQSQGAPTRLCPPWLCVSLQSKGAPTRLCLPWLCVSLQSQGAPTRLCLGSNGRQTEGGGARSHLEQQRHPAQPHPLPAAPTASQCMLRSSSRPTLSQVSSPAPLDAPRPSPRRGPAHPKEAPAALHLAKRLERRP